ncbi:MAG TPA: hypothetical protein PKO06_13535 [Candidatus Ozemobacteraceae bacterium]|nr:hypothetical protein [Candidatus Ozemobacteraceae bacterium]
MTTFLVSLVLAFTMKLFSAASSQSSDLEMRQMSETEKQRLLTALRADCRSAKSVLATPEAVEIVRFQFDQANNITEQHVAYLYVAGNIVRHEGDVQKAFEFLRYEKQGSKLQFRFETASPATLLLYLKNETTDVVIMNEKIVYETTR